MTHLVFVQQGFDLAVAAMAGQNDHFGTASPDLFDFFSSIVNPLVFERRQQGPAATAAAVLIGL